VHRIPALIIACIIGFALPAIADESLAIVTQRSSPVKSVSLETLKQVFLRKSLLDTNGNRWIPLNLPITDELRQDFSLVLFNKLPEDQEDYWNEQYFHGINPPQVLASEEAVLRFVEITPGAIGYVHKRNVDERVKILTTLSIPAHN
jgi:hypothetical protein